MRPILHSLDKATDGNLVQQYYELSILALILLFIHAGKLSRTLSWWCFNPGLAMAEFAKLGVRSIILTSGTLSPLESCAHEMNLYVKIFCIAIFTFFSIEMFL